METSPLVSVLITTFNRKDVLKRCLTRVLNQTFRDFEVVVIDDCSSDGTEAMMRAYTDPRIRYIRNEQNAGATYGDRIHIKRFVYELSRGKYFVYVCDDDYWISDRLLERQVAYFAEYPNAVMVTGGQLSCFLDPGEEAPLIDESNVEDYLKNVPSNEFGPKAVFFKNTFPRTFMTSDEFLDHFSTYPMESNMIGGARLYDRELFMRSGALQSMDGSKWQAGYELTLGPACYGDSVYINEPCIFTEIRANNASFNRTQREHYMDCIISINKAFNKPFADWKHTSRLAFLKQVKRRTVENIGSIFMNNTLSIKRYGRLGMCTEENMRVPVTAWTILTSRLRSGARFPRHDLRKMAYISAPQRLIRAYDKRRMQRAQRAT